MISSNLDLCASERPCIQILPNYYSLCFAFFTFLCFHPIYFQCEQDALRNVALCGHCPYTAHTLFKLVILTPGQYFTSLAIFVRADSSRYTLNPMSVQGVGELCALWYAWSEMGQ